MRIPSHIARNVHMAGVGRPDDLGATDFLHRDDPGVGETRQLASDDRLGKTEPTGELAARRRLAEEHLGEQLSLRLRPEDREQLWSSGRHTRSDTDALRQLVAYAAGVPHIVRDEYVDVAAIDEVFIHGSWAARFHGAPGPPPDDLDLVIVTSTHARFTLAEHRAAIEAAAGLTVDQMVLLPDHDQLATLRDGSVPVITLGDDS
jgi:hypothetical protein